MREAFTKISRDVGEGRSHCPLLMEKSGKNIFMAKLKKKLRKKLMNS